MALRIADQTDGPLNRQRDPEFGADAAHLEQPGELVVAQR
jgi:hypothetical protein